MTPEAALVDSEAHGEQHLPMNTAKGRHRCARALFQDGDWSTLST